MSTEAHDNSGSDNAGGAGGTSPWSAAERQYQPLERSGDDRMIAGVAAGVADYFGLEVTIVRIAFVVLALAGGIGIPAYLAGWLLMPDAECGWSIADDILQHARLR
ncbi:MAG: PspC domain-containing protein [Acidimicrobiales bacterium]